ncbi:MAG: hypothetical protein AAB487_03620 [Patescibacteria group bacterium]
MEQKKADSHGYTQEEFRRDCRVLAERIPPIDAIVGLMGNRTGGIKLALRISKLKEIRNITTMSYVYEKKDGDLIISTIVPPHQILMGKRVLLCTDISNSGVTLFRALEDMGVLGIYPVVCSIHYRKGSLKEPDYYMHLVETDIQYEWEDDDI